MDPGFSRWPAPAKLNLFLRITGRRADGYHELQTFYQLLDWGDEIDIAATSDGSITREAGPADIDPESDLSVRAAQLLQARTASSRGARIRVHKHIPVGAGLGGGSSDAATVLLALNQAWRCGLEREQLAELGLELGADVPVFIWGRSGWAEGVGERLLPMDRGERHYVLVFPEIQIRTGELFAAPELDRVAPPLEPSDADLASHGNAFEPVVMARYPQLAAILSELMSFGRPRLTGTGSCIFLPVADKFSADSLTSQLKSRYNVRAVRGIDRSPVLLERSSGC
jgi:4-diphosphocytidyl-2-C-methyl-D-erythritol kinase